MAKLLFPVITYQNQMRTAICLVQIDLKPRSNPLRGNWKQICKQVREVLERCVYVDKDLVLPFLGTSSQQQTLFVVACTDLMHSRIMIDRIRSQFEKIEELKLAGDFDIRASEVPLPDHATTISLEQQVQAIADRVTVMTEASMCSNVSDFNNPEVN